MAVRTPTTVIGTPLISTVWPTGSWRLKSSAAVVGARTVTASSSRKRPWATVRERTVNHEGVDPTTVVVQLAVPAVRLSDDCVMGATALISGATVFDSRADTSAVVSVVAEPSASRIPALEVELPGVMVRMLVPSEVISELT